jgi:thioesterase domain-containing protein
MWEANGAYRPRDYAGAATLFRAQIRAVNLTDGVAAWRKVVRGGLNVEHVPGGHGDVVHEPNVGVLAERLSVRLLDSAADPLPVTTTSGQRPSR